MSGFSTGRIAIAVCDRCNLKMSYQKLRADGDQPGLRVCKDCRDNKDPYKLPQRPMDTYLLRFPRPDTTITVNPADPPFGGIVYAYAFQDDAFQDGAFQI